MDRRRPLAQTPETSVLERASGATGRERVVSQAQQQPSPASQWARRVVVALLILSTLLTATYTGLSIYIATALESAPQRPATQTPADKSLAYREVVFPSRDDKLLLKGWFIPGVKPDGGLTDERTIVMAHGTRANRSDPGMGLLDIAAELARRGFAVLTFDMRGSGVSPAAPLSLGYFEQRDVLGAVDFLRAGTPPYPELPRPRVIGGWGVSMGAATLLLAAAREPAIQAVVSDSAYADIIPILQHEIPKQGHVSPVFTPGALLAIRVLYGIDFAAVRPVDVVAGLAPRPLFFIHGGADTYVPPDNMHTLVAAASAPTTANVRSWTVPSARHAQAYRTSSADYVTRVVDFFVAALGPDATHR